MNPEAKSIQRMRINNLLIKKEKRKKIELEIIDTYAGSKKSSNFLKLITKNGENQLINQFVTNEYMSFNQTI